MKTSTLRNVLLTSAMAFGIAGFAQAQTPAPQGGEHKAELSHKEMKRAPKHYGGMSIFNPKLVERLALTSEQKAKYEELDKLQQSVMKQHKAEIQKFIQERKDLLSAKVVDLKALLENAAQLQHIVGKEGDQVRDKTLDLWNSLNQEQKLKVTQFLQEQDKRFAERVQQMKRHHDAKHNHQ